MDNLKNNNKILFIPGWLDGGELHGFTNSLDIWNKDIDIKKNFEVDFVIAHSVGALVALSNWKIYKNFKIILINPVFLKRNISKRWLKSMISESTHYSFKRMIIFLSTIPAFIKAIKLFKVPVISILNTIPPDGLIIIYGENDKYLCDRELVNSLKDRFRTIGVKGAGHNYNIDMENAIIDNLKTDNPKLIN